MDLLIAVRGTPAPQGSKRALVNKHTGKASMTESSADRVKSWRSDVRDAAEKAMADQGWLTGQGRPMRVSVAFRMRRPKGHYGTGRNAALLKLSAPSVPAGAPDIDKLLRSTLDALGSASVWGDDSQVVEVHAWKVYAGQGDPTGAGITVAAIAGPD